jgi:RHS repeat-associated protein
VSVIIVTRSLSYDTRGNLSAETRPGAVTASTSYDGYARLTSYARTGEASLSFIYNGMDDRVREVRGTTTRRYLYDGAGRILGEYGASASDVIAEHLWLSPDAANDNQPFGGDDGINGYAPLAIASAPTGGTAQLIWVHSNHMGVPLTYTNNTGAEVTPPSFTQSAFPGQMKTLPDLYYNRYRDYDPSTGRYIQADPIGLAGDPNPYAYAMNNPLRYSDPEGLAAGGAAAGSGRAGPGGMMAGLWDWYINHWYKPLPYPKEGVDLKPETQCSFDGRLLMATKAPGKPGPKDGYKEPKSGPRKARAPNGKYGWVDDKGNIWVPTGPDGSPDAHGGAHWDVQGRRGGYTNVYPGGSTR